jgi:hypothetical protein
LLAVRRRLIVSIFSVLSAADKTGLAVSKTASPLCKCNCVVILGVLVLYELVFASNIHTIQPIQLVELPQTDAQQGR